MDKDLLKKCVKNSLEDEFKKGMSEFIKVLIEQSWQTPIDDIVETIEESMTTAIADIKKKAYDDAYNALKKEFEEKEDAAFKRGVEYGRGIVSKIDKVNNSSNDVYSELLKQLFGDIFK